MSGEQIEIPAVSDSLIFVSYADISGMRSGENIRAGWDRKTLYLKNCCVSLASAKHYNPECDAALVTNIDVPEPYVSVLRDAGVRILQVPFERFRFDENYSWGLAFYKLCALYHVAFETSYRRFLCLDSDVYVQSSLSDFWPETEDHVMLWDTNHRLNNGSYVKFLQELEAFNGCRKRITHYGGEFFGASQENGRTFLRHAAEVFEEMQRQNFRTSVGDEFITSIVADRDKPLIKNAESYVFRFSTGRFRLVSSRYRAPDPVSVLHMPMEKNRGMLVLYDRYIGRGKIPAPKVVWRTLHLSRDDAVSICKRIAARILHRD